MKIAELAMWWREAQEHARPQIAARKVLEYMQENDEADLEELRELLTDEGVEPALQLHVLANLVDQGYLREGESDNYFLGMKGQEAKEKQEEAEQRQRDEDRQRVRQEQEREDARVRGRLLADRLQLEEQQRQKAAPPRELSTTRLSLPGDDALRSRIRRLARKPRKPDKVQLSAERAPQPEGASSDKILDAARVLVTESDKAKAAQAAALAEVDRVRKAEYEAERERAAREPELVRRIEKALSNVKIAVNIEAAPAQVINVTVPPMRTKLIRDRDGNAIGSEQEYLSPPAVQLSATGSEVDSQQSGRRIVLDGQTGVVVDP